MTITPGTRLGPYEISASVGAGGMGEVYRGRDTRLDRDVAIKILPAHFAGQSELKLRFEREAKTISQLNHPNICSLYDVGHEDGHDFLVMEFLEGETLAQRLTEGPLPLEKVLEHGSQIAGALDKAHRSGVIHRDLKPSNIVLTATGAKLLDFGLAKFSTPSEPIQGLTVMPTQQRPLTQEGTILGTLQYMAPEQLEGVEADARTDIFAFGAVLYEMLTGRRAFEGKTKTSLIAAIVDREPPSISSLQPLTPPALQHVVRRCLEKDPEDRWQNAHDVKTQLQWIAEAGSQAGIAAPVLRRRRHREALAWALHLVTALAAAALTWGLIEMRRDPPRMLQTSIPAPPAASFRFVHGMALSPDGRRIAFIAQTEHASRMLWVRPLDGAAAQPLAGTENAMHPFWSPDSAHLGFFAGGKLKRISAAGGPPQTVCDAVDGRGGSWNRDGVIVFSPSTRDSIHRVPAIGGTPAPVTRLETEHDVSHRFPSFLPDGRHFIYSRRGSGGTAHEKHGLFLGSLDGKVGRELVKTPANGTVVAPGYLLFWRDGSLVAQRFDLDEFSLTGEAVPIAENVEYTAKYEAIFSVMPAGMLAFHQSSGGGSFRLVWVDRSGKELGIVGPLGDYQNPAVSHDGRKVAVSLNDPSTRTEDIWIHDLQRPGAAARLTFDPADDYTPVWSPDDKVIAYSSNRKTSGAIFTRRSSGAGAEEAVYETPGQAVAIDWPAAAQALLLQESRPGTAWDIWLYSPAEKKGRILVQTPFSELLPQMSPGGRWLLYQSNESGRLQIFVQDLDGDGGKWLISPRSGFRARWSRSGKEIFYWSDDQLFAVPVETSPEFQAGVPEPLFKAALRGAPGFQYDVAPDGRFLLNLPVEESEVAPITLVQNWTRLLDR